MKDIYYFFFKLPSFMSYYWKYSIGMYIGDEMDFIRGLLNLVDNWNIINEDNFFLLGSCYSIGLGMYFATLDINVGHIPNRWGEKLKSILSKKPLNIWMTEYDFNSLFVKTID